MEDKRLIEGFLPIETISKEASREKSVRKGHIFTLHLWWARRPLVACRAAVYGALVPASRFQPVNGPEEKRASLGRANAAKFVERLCKYPGDPRVIAEAQQHILEAHAERLSRERGEPVTVTDIIEGRAPRPKVLDMFAGGGAIPLEALRLGCEAYAIDLNPVAHIIELCTLVYPQKYGKPDPTAKGSAKDGTWAGLAEEVRYWGNWVLGKVKAEIGDLYPLIPDPKKSGGPGFQPGRLQPMQGDLFITRRNLPHWQMGGSTYFVTFRTTGLELLREARKLVLDACLHFDGQRYTLWTAVVMPDHVHLLLRPEEQEPGQWWSLSSILHSIKSFTAKEINNLLRHEGSVWQDESFDRIVRDEEEFLEKWNYIRDNPVKRELCSAPEAWDALYEKVEQASVRQASSLSQSTGKMPGPPTPGNYDRERAKAAVTYLAFAPDKVAEIGNSFGRWEPVAQCTRTIFGRQALPMLWDYGESVPIATSAGNWNEHMNRVLDSIELSAIPGAPAVVSRGSAITLSWPDASFDAVITDPPYYDNVPYADISDFFYVWLKRTVGHLYPEHFATELTPKKAEAMALSSRHGGDMAKANAEYERMMLESFRQAFRVLKPNGQMAIVYAHKTALGWATLVDAMRRAGFTVTEAWPLDTEMGSRLLAMDSAALASSIFLVARKREGSGIGSYEDDVQPELARIVRERVETLWEMGIVGADLVIAAVGAGLRAFTRFERVEYANGEEVPAEKFLAEVEGVVLETLLEKIFRVGQASNLSSTGRRPVPLGQVDGPSRFYMLWRYTYKAAEMDAGEAIVFTHGQRVELDGPRGLSSGSRALVEKKKGKYRLRDFTERGNDEKLGLSDVQIGTPAPLIDVLHRILWLIENEPRSLGKFLDEARPDRERLRLVAQALAGAGLKGKSEEDTKAMVATTTAEQSALGKLLANWRALIESSAAPLFELRSE